jgi:hypothetical protein
MFGSLARRGASVVVAAGLLGGGVALGSGTAGAATLADPAEIAAGSAVVALVGVGSLDTGYLAWGCARTCVTPTDYLEDWLRGEADPGSTAGPLSGISG